MQHFNPLTIGTRPANPACPFDCSAIEPFISRQPWQYIIKIWKRCQKMLRRGIRDMLTCGPKRSIYAQGKTSQSGGEQTNVQEKHIQNYRSRSIALHRV